MTLINGGPCHTIRGMGDEYRVVHTTPCSCGKDEEHAEAALAQDEMVQLVVTQADTVFCTRCLSERRCQDPRDEDPNNWHHAFIPWSPDQPCEDCGRTSPYDEDLTPAERLALKRVRQQQVQPSPYLPDPRD